MWHILCIEKRIPTTARFFGDASRPVVPRRNFLEFFLGNSISVALPCQGSGTTYFPTHGRSGILSCHQIVVLCWDSEEIVVFLWLQEHTTDAQREFRTAHTCRRESEQMPLEPLGEIRYRKVGDGGNRGCLLSSSMCESDLRFVDHTRSNRTRHVEAVQNYTKTHCSQSRSGQSTI